MIPSLYGVLVALVGLYLWFRPAEQMLAFVVFCSLFPAAAALYLPALGGSSIPPAFFALAFLALRLARRDILKSSGPPLAIRRNAWLLVFCLYSAATALVLPGMFAGQVNLIPMGAASLGFVPLKVTPQNTTTAVYLLGTGFTALASTAIGTRPNSTPTLITAFVVVTWIHVLTGVADILFSAAGIQGAFDVFRNGSYLQLGQTAGGFRRISGLCSEASSYAALGSFYFTFMTELWLRRISPWRTGPAALAMFVLLVLTTSSTAYVFLGGYGVVLLVRGVFVRGAVPLDRALPLLGLALISTTAGLATMLLHPSFFNDLVQILADMILNKAQTESGLERALWAKQGFTALSASHGLGVGAGSFRSSSLFTAVLGSIGPVGLVLLGGYCLQVGNLTRRSTYVAGVDPRQGAGAAAAWTVLLALIPASVSSPSPDPGLLFGMMAGLALAWRSRRSAAAPRASTGVAPATG